MGFLSVLFKWCNLSSWKSAYETVEGWDNYQTNGWSVCMVHSVSNSPNSKPCSLCFTKYTSTGKWKHALLTGKEFFIVRSCSRCSEPIISLLLLPNKPASLPSYHTTDSLIPIGHPSRNNRASKQKTNYPLLFTCTVILVSSKTVNYLRRKCPLSLQFFTCRIQENSS